MKKFVFGGMILLSATSLVGCGSQIGSSVRQAVTVNQEAKSLVEWENSEANPEALFANWRHDFMVDSTKRESMKEELCKELNELDGQSLTIFENEIRDENNRALVSSCKEELLQKVDAHFDKERETLDVQGHALKAVSSSNNFQFPTNIQKRDTSKGYFAVTGDVVRKEVIITFDDGPNGQYTDAILRAFKEVNAKAIFFHMGKAARANPDIVKRVAADGHSIGTHSTTHACLGSSSACRKTNGRNLTFDEAVAEIKGGHQAVYDAIGWVDPFFRFPYGEASPELKNFLKTNSTGEFFWSIDSNDWRAQTNENLLRTTIAELEKRGRGQVLFHDIQRKTAEIMPQFLRELYNRGYSVVLLQPADMSARYNSKLVKKRLP
ncbi:polysaccharide deacetylase family protein [Bdellovibrio bacteriovorus]|uniref:polysaccharide deacetylase family protein n=1 Tax=Bdellovibrio bacteriovorus TaxID=959 RepID=UPI0021CEF789|nr:polysaccharide deacetylase family protein [Bdellovibrio bacteriovorus]UXR64365.1 polysaccharide deacetylase family protein [Bdellovibrio bacteriovorus]